MIQTRFLFLYQDQDLVLVSRVLLAECDNFIKFVVNTCIVLSLDACFTHKYKYFLKLHAYKF